VRVLSREEEARYGYLAAVNSTTLADGVALDLGGGSMQLTCVQGRLAEGAASWPLGAVRMTERFLPGERAKGKQIKALRAHVAEELAAAPWLARGGRLVGVGGTVRNLAAAAELAADLPSYGVQGFAIEREALDDLVERLADLPAPERSSVPGIKAARGDLILAGALVVQCVMEAGGFEALEVTEAGLREGVFYETLLAGEEPPLFEDVRRASVVNLATAYHTNFAHNAARRAPGPRALGRARERRRPRRRPARARPPVGGRDAARHRDGRRLRRPPQALPLPHPQRRPARLQPARDGPDRPDRPLPPQGKPGLGEFGPLARKGDEDLLARCAAVLRVAEQLERPRDQTVLGTRVKIDGDRVRLRLKHKEDVTVSRWAAERQGDLFKRAFGLELAIAD
jgi:exopolyphosphatase/guanosine-5'-triphosphate,3'-diphosphate pyrophosphatase